MYQAGVASLHARYSYWLTWQFDSWCFCCYSDTLIAHLPMFLTRSLLWLGLSLDSRKSNLPHGCYPFYAWGCSSLTTDFIFKSRLYEHLTSFVTSNECCCFWTYSACFAGKWHLLVWCCSEKASSANSDSGVGCGCQLAFHSIWMLHAWTIWSNYHSIPWIGSCSSIRRLFGSGLKCNCSGLGWSRWVANYPICLVVMSCFRGHREKTLRLHGCVSHDY